MDKSTFFIEVLKYTSPVLIALIAKIPIEKRKNTPARKRSSSQRKEG